MRVRGFEVVKRLEDIENEVLLPKRGTTDSAGYDFFAYEDVTIPSIWKSLMKFTLNRITRMPQIDILEVAPTLVKTGIKAYMQKDEVLKLYNRSSNPKKLGLLLANGTGIIDADYYENPDNDGEIGFAFYNILPFDVTIKKGGKIGQGIFSTYLKSDNDDASGARSGGFGSTGN